MLYRCSVHRRYVLVGMLAAVAACHQGKPAIAPAPQPAGAEGAERPDSARPSLPAGPPRAPAGVNTKPYDQVVNGAATSDAGLFKVHRVGDRLLFEIPPGALGKDMLLMITKSRASHGAGFGGQGAAMTRLIRWERRDNRVLIREPDYTIRADSNDAVFQGVTAATEPLIIAALDVETVGPDSGAVVDVTGLFTTPPPQFFDGSVDPARTFLEKVSAFPENIEVEATVTTIGENGGTFLIHWSMLKLPDVPITPRLADKRVGYASVSTVDFSRSHHRAETRKYITRFRLECSERRAGDLCYPKKPITFFLAREVPTWLVPWVRRGVESWQLAFEAAGFKDGIIARAAPLPADDPNWSPEDARYSVVRWQPATSSGAGGRQYPDPRSGELISAGLVMNHNVLVRVSNWYWTQAAPLDPRARTLPLPDSLLGRLIEYIVAHEVGHSIGLLHNVKASATYPLDSLRNRAFVRRMGHTPSLMDYSRLNYVAQPEDSIAPEDLVPKIGPYDIWAVRWGYRLIPGANTPDEERSTLDAWAREQDATPWLRTSTNPDLLSPDDTDDPFDNVEAVGDADAVRASTLGLRNLRRLVPMLLPAATKPTEDNSELVELYDSVVEQWWWELSHVVRIIGGVESRQKYGSQPGPMYWPVSGARQREAVRFLLDAALQPPTFLIDREIVSRIGSPGVAIAKLSGKQADILKSMLDEKRINRLVEFEATAGPLDDLYLATRYLADVRQGVWSELQARSVRIGVFRRRLQTAYLDIVKDELAAPDAAAPMRRVAPDVSALLAADLKTLQRDLAAAGNAVDAVTRAHLAQARADVNAILKRTQP